MAAETRERRILRRVSASQPRTHTPNAYTRGQPREAVSSHNGREQVCGCRDLNYLSRVASRCSQGREWTQPPQKVVPRIFVKLESKITCQTQTQLYKQCEK